MNKENTSLHHVGTVRTLGRLTFTDTKHFQTKGSVMLKTDESKTKNAQLQIV